MSKLILIESSSSLCSVALAIDEEIVRYIESEESRVQASMLTPFVGDILKAEGLKVSDCDAVCLSAGPGSYTGLRVGSSTAKGLCFAANIPLISVGTLEILVAQALSEGLVPEGCNYIIPMIDARRMEVYSTVFSPKGEALTEVEAMVIDSNSFSKERAEGQILFIGDGAEKCKEQLACEGGVFVQTYPKASAMLHPALREYKEKRFKDIAYFEPFYLKDFVATTSKKKLF